MLNLGDKRTFISLILGATLVLVGLSHFLSVFEMIGIPIKISGLLVPLIAVIAGILCFLSGIWSYETAVQFSLFLLLFGFILSVAGIFFGLNRFGWFSLPPILLEESVYFGGVIIAGLLAFVSSFRH